MYIYISILYIYIIGNYNCDSANVVYLIHCQVCPEAQYIEETGGNFRYRFNNHTHFHRHKKLIPLSLHFNADGHSINDINVCILKGNFKDTKHRKLTELQFIIYSVANQYGFNKDISFLSKYDTFMALRLDISNSNVILFSPLFFPAPTVIATLVVALFPTELLYPHNSDLSMFST